ncbi:mucin-13-like [Anarrhichthys ocellatus]|uniref:mucin-13-like n=1 Tax=Anarrhichthys ocellatus TaxID=433405 RepID=UPI0012EE4609|nr:mucin-13-like [Anarrhichthys ocellatus]
MAPEFKLFFVLWLVVACVAGQSTAATDTTTTSVASTAATDTTTTSVASTAATGATTTSVAPTTTKLPDPCDGNPCYDGSTCEDRSNQTFECVCFAGDDYNYDLKSCVSAKVFPGQLDLPNLRYHQNMTTKTSPEFQKASIQINDELSVIFKNYSFSRSTVLEFRELSTRKVMSRSEDGVSATVDIIFHVNSDIATAEVVEKLTDPSKCTVDCHLANASFHETDLCLKNPCDKDTTSCLWQNGSYNCTCLQQFIETDFSRRICTACPNGQQVGDSKICVDCSFGYSGVDCQDSWLQTLVIVSSVLGILLLIALILLPILASRSSKKSSKKDTNADMGKPAKQPLVNGNLAQSQGARWAARGPANGSSAFANAGVPRIPRATTTNSWDSRSNLEMTPSNSRQNLIPVGRNPRLYNDQDDMNPNAQVRPQSNLYAQARPLNNPYAQSPPQTNPYAQSQGHSNSHYTHDNGSRFN